MADTPALHSLEAKVVLSASTDPLVIRLARDGGFDVLRAQLRGLLEADAERYRGVNALLDIGERNIDLFDLRRLVHLVKDEFGVNIVSMRCHPRCVHVFAEKELKLRVQLIEPEASASPVELPVASLETPPPPPPPPLAGERTQQVRRTLRSGTQVRFGGDVVIYGDVNPGAQVVAGGSILVLGALKGMAHAGARGNDDTFILAFELQPTQLRIGGLIAIPPESPSEAPKTQGPEIAFVRNHQIVIEPWRGRLPRSGI
jgi:septum site-determining protein MinC